MHREDSGMRVNGQEEGTEFEANTFKSVVCLDPRPVPRWACQTRSTMSYPTKQGHQAQ